MTSGDKIKHHYYLWSYVTYVTNHVVKLRLCAMKIAKKSDEFTNILINLCVCVCVCVCVCMFYCISESLFMYALGSEKVVHDLRACMVI